MAAAQQTTVPTAQAATLSAIGDDLFTNTRERTGRTLCRHILDVAFTILASSGFHMLLFYRIGAFAHRLHLLPVCVLIEKFIYHWYQCIIPCSLPMGSGIMVPHPKGIVITKTATIGRRIWLFQDVQLVSGNGGTVVIGDGCVLFAGAMVIGTQIGEESIVAARALVVSPVPPRHLAVGMPATIKPLRADQLANRQHQLVR